MPQNRRQPSVSPSARDQMQQQLFEKMIGGNTPATPVGPSLTDLVAASEHFIQRIETTQSQPARDKHTRRLARITRLIDDAIGFQDEGDI